MDFYNSGEVTGMEAMETTGLGGSKMSENGQQQKYPWKFTADGGIRKKKKPTPAQKNQRFKKVVQPKNAVMCLNELVPNVVYVMEQEGNGTKTHTIMAIEVNGQKYRGFGSSKQLAKQAAAEAALVSFVKPMPSTEEEDDATPWTTLASFAMFKLFNEWREGRYGGLPDAPPGQNMAISQTLQTILNHHAGTTASGQKAPSAMKQHSGASLGGNFQSNNANQSAGNGNMKVVPNPAKTVPANAATIHPVMLLHQMRPELVYSQNQTQRGGQQVYVVSCILEGREYSGEGTNVKKAKYELALKVNQSAFGVISTYVGTK